MKVHSEYHVMKNCFNGISFKNVRDIIEWNVIRMRALKTGGSLLDLAYGAPGLGPINVCKSDLFYCNIQNAQKEIAKDNSVT